ncbi:MAG: DNA polymerase/3'-5' exonuclease PolX [Pseudomonadota bacterium]|nr:DNA polymerase/3'-5' exonuclease PolX [Pseudomonadota bacterium]
MTVHNKEIADLFNQLADILEIEGANPFRVRAYRNAARFIGESPRSLAEQVKAGEDLTQLPGIGKDLAQKIVTIVETGHLPALEVEVKHIPQGIIDMTRLPGLGPKRVKKLHETLGINNLADLKAAALEHKIALLSGFGIKTEAKILAELERGGEKKKRFLLSKVDDIANELTEYLQAIPGVNEVTVAGSFRRRVQTVGDLDILVTAKNGVDVIDAFVKFPKVRVITSQGTTRSTVLLHSDLQVDLRVVPKIHYGAAMHYFTGSKAHNIELRNRALKHGWKFNEYGVFEGDKSLASKTEQEIYQLFNLPYIPPELRENRGEFEAAEKNQLPKLVELSDIRGDLHAHTTETDGANTLEEMVQAAIAFGYGYLAITDHTKNLAMVRGQDEKRVLQQIKKIQKLNKKVAPFRILTGAEVDILVDGSLDLDDEVLAQLDIVVCSIHSRFNLPEEQQTARVLKAMENPHFKILGHPTGRLINHRAGHQVNLEAIIKCAKHYSHCLELNAQPSRMDLDDHHCRLAKEHGVKLVISTDAHSINQLHNMKFGVGQARRGWLEAGDVINTLSLKKLLTYLHKS